MAYYLFLVITAYFYHCTYVALMNKERVENLVHNDFEEITIRFLLLCVFFISL